MTKKLKSLNMNRLSYPGQAQFVTRTLDDIEQSGIRFNTDESLPVLTSFKSQQQLLPSQLYQTQVMLFR